MAPFCSATLVHFYSALDSAHIQVEGELRSREYVPKKVGKKQPEKKTIWEIRVNSIFKLDRAAKASAGDNDESTEEEAA